MDVLRVRAGLIEAPLPGGLIHCYVSGKCDWWTIHEAAPQFREGYA
jgi:hypothetical protein